MGNTRTQAQVAAEVAVANAETAVVESAIAAEAAEAIVEPTNDVYTGIIKSFNFTPASASKTGKAYNIMHIAVEGEDDDVVAYPYDGELESALGLNDLVAFVDVCDVRERRKTVLFRDATVEFGYDDDERLVINKIKLAKASKAAALSGIN